jgi:hypothetical protein
VSLRRHAASRDANEPEIVQTFESCGWVVARLSDPGIPDLLCARPKKLILVEVKMPGQKLTEAQKLFWATWPHPIHVVRSVEEAQAVAEWEK